MKLWLLTRPPDEPAGYDEYAELVVAAEGRHQATKVMPVDDVHPAKDSWISADKVVVEYIGEAAPQVEAGVVLASFQAG